MLWEKNMETKVKFVEWYMNKYNTDIYVHKICKLKLLLCTYGGFKTMILGLTQKAK